MTLIALQLGDRLHGPGQLLDDLIHRQVPEIPCGQRAEHPETDVGRTGAHRQLVLMEDLVVVGRKPGGLVADKVREIAPGSVGPPSSATSDPFQEAGSAAALPAAEGSRASRSEGKGTTRRARGRPTRGSLASSGSTAQPTIPLNRLIRPMERQEPGRSTSGRSNASPGPMSTRADACARRAGDTTPAEWHSRPARPGAEAGRHRRPSAAGRGPASRRRGSSAPDGWSPR